ncbi:MAG: hypothetical protein ACRELA_01650, partial [Candidatus Rokuibacteriota bacterium]
MNNAQRRVLMVVSVALLGVLAFVGAAADRRPVELKATRFVLTDAQDRGRAELRAEPDGAVALQLTDASGVTRARLALAADGSPHLALHGGDGRPRVRVTV